MKQLSSHSDSELQSQVSCYTTARIDRVLFSEAGAETGDAEPDIREQAEENRGLDTFGGCLSSLTR